MYPYAALCLVFSQAWRVEMMICRVSTNYVLPLETVRNVGGSHCVTPRELPELFRNAQQVTHPVRPDAEELMYIAQPIVAFSDQSFISLPTPENGPKLQAPLHLKPPVSPHIQPSPQAKNTTRDAGTKKQAKPKNTSRNRTIGKIGGAHGSSGEEEEEEEEEEGTQDLRGDGNEGRR
ncbi:hypothetical protein C7212DRAFT_343672 [Tuber magnatum]|uniref:Uncharacterized protein n=1 Tax=Tuber magnatum TaxID=42249 RepID=A0A317SPY0_9PEZI|nr:hypothetical protein C7212DRAFT_343672 [Tuber magnatum]